MEKKEYEFKAHDDGRKVGADIFFDPRPKSSARPIAILFHGGAFCVGSKELVPEVQVRKLTMDFNFVVVVPDYRLCPTISLYDGPLADAKSVLRWAQNDVPGLLKRDANIVLDGAKIVAIGYSAGGTLALSLASTPKPPVAIIDFYGAKYLSDPFWTKPLPALEGLPPFEQAFMDRVYDEIPAPTSVPLSLESMKNPDFSRPRIAWMFTALKEGRLFQHIVPDGDLKRVDPTTYFGPRFPPTLFVHGTADTLIDVRLSKNACDQLQGLGAEARLLLVEGADHGFDAGIDPDDEKFVHVLAAFKFGKDHVEG